MIMINAPSLANCSVLNLGRDVDELFQAGVDFFHVDIMDGHYVPNICLPVRTIGDIKSVYPKAIVDVHLMVTNPIDYIEPLKKEGTNYVAFHSDATSFAGRALVSIRKAGMKAGVVINPSQRIDVIEPYIHLLDYVILMTVEPGIAGQRFLPGGLERLSQLADLRKERNANFLIEVDGGVDYENARECVIRGADILVTGIFVVFNQPDGIANACKRFKDFFADTKAHVRLS